MRMRDLADDPSVDRLIELRRIFLHAVVQDEELRDERDELLALPFDGGSQQQGGLILVSGLRLHERLVDRRPERGDRRHQPLLLRGRTFGRRQRLLGHDRLIQIRFEAIEGLAPRHHRITFGAIRHVAHRERQLATDCSGCEAAAPNRAGCAR